MERRRSESRQKERNRREEAVPGFRSGDETRGFRLARQLRGGEQDRQRNREQWNGRDSNDSRVVEEMAVESGWDFRATERTKTGQHSERTGQRSGGIGMNCRQ